MSENKVNSVLRRKAQIGQEQFQARAMTAARALRITLAKVAEDDMGLALAAIGLTESCGPAEPVLKALDDTTLLILLDSPGRGPGAALLDSALTGAIVQQQTTGRVSELRENVPLRKPTRTDAALVATFLDSLFKRAGPLPDLTSQMQMLSGLRFGAGIASPRLLSMSLEASEYAHFSITVDIANGTRQGKIDLLLPRADVQADTAPDDTEATEPPATTLEPMVMSLNAQLRVALCRLRMPFSRLAELSPGDQIPLPEGVMQNAEVLTIAGRKVANGQLGQIDGLRAVRLEHKGAEGESVARGASDRAGGQDRQSAYGGAPGRTSHSEHDDGTADLDLSGIPDLPDLPGDDPTGFPDLPDLPDFPEIDDAMGDLPDLPELPDFNGLPELPDLPGESFGESGDLPFAKHA